MPEARKLLEENVSGNILTFIVSCPDHSKTWEVIKKLPVF